MSLTQQLQELETAFTAATEEETVIGRVESVSGVRVAARFDPAQRDRGSFDLAIGTLLGIRSRDSLVIGVLYELEIDAAAAGGPAAIARGTHRSGQRNFVV
jgi:hypothetical protein